jgi:hypothetical protein
MERVVLEGISADDLPAAWRQRLDRQPAQRYRVIIEAETGTASTAVAAREVAIFGMWSDRADMAEPTAWVDSLRERPARRD